MFCQHCGFEYKHKTNYCKSCGGNLTSSDNAPVAQLPSLKITGVFFVIAALVLFGLMQIYSVYMRMLYAGVRGAELFVPLLLGFALLGAVALLLARLLSWAIAGSRQQMDQAANRARITYVEVPTLDEPTTPTDPIRNAVESPSVVEHTTRQMARVYKSPAAHE